MKKIIVGNWKMNPQNISEARNIFLKIRRKSGMLKRARAVICPPIIFVGELSRLSNRTCEIGAQDAFWADEGAYTGEISSEMLKECGATHVILGHSEKRVLGDSDEIVNKKIRSVFDKRLLVVLCVGEKERDEDGHYLTLLKNQIRESLAKISKKYFQSLIIAYEPVWAIGANAKGVSTPDDYLEKAIYIRKILSQLSDKETAMTIPILYGGSVDAKNASGFLREGRADGLLVGRASLDPISFNSILSQTDAL